VNALKLRNDDVSCALITPIDYAKESSDFHIVPGIAVSSRGASETIRLFFRSGARRIETVAVDIGSTSEIILTRILLAERYDTEPKFIPMMPVLEPMLEKADAALLVGDNARSVPASARFIDLVDEWEDLTDLPYTHAFWGCRPGSLNADDIHLLHSVRDEGLRNIPAIATEAAANGGTQASLEEYFGQFSYTFDEETEDSISEFFRFAFFYGVINDIPDIRFVTEEGSAS
jgi:chorismate dehydratase